MKVKSDYEPDIRLCLDHFKPSKKDAQARDDLLDILTEILNERFGNGFDVEYVGIGRYATDIQQAPLEIAIIDVQSELGVVGRDYACDLPDIYSPSVVARALAREGFRGRINNHSLSRTTPVKLAATKEYVRPSQTEDDENTEWLRFNHIPRRGLVYPERLCIEHPIAFDLILPGPTTVPLVRMLEEYSKLVPVFRDLVSISYLWCHSLGMREISSTCLALLFVSFLQETIGIPGITFPTSFISDYAAKQYHLSKTGGKWAVHEISPGDGHWSDEIVALETEFIIQTSVKYNDLDKSRLLREFMNFLNRNVNPIKGPIVSVGTGRKIPRDAAQYLGSTVKSLSELLRNLSDSPYTLMRPPQLWKIHPLIVQDPFTYTHNHAEFVSIQTVNALAHNARVAVGKINVCHSLVEILGIDLVCPADALREALVLQDEANPIRPHVKLARSATVRKIQDVVRQNYGTNYRVELFGSTSYGADSPTSDLDLVIVDTSRMDGFPPTLDLNNLPREPVLHSMDHPRTQYSHHPQAIYNVKNVGWALSRAGFTGVFPIPSATVPIVKFKDPATGLECDINVNDQLGFINTSMIRHYVSLQPVLIPLLRLIKRWAKPLGMNSPSKRPLSFSSYAFNLMTIAWFQSLGWLPNLQDDVTAKNAAPTGHFWIKNRKGERFRCDTRFKAAENRSADPGKSVGELFLGWLGFWGREFKYDESIACIRKGGIIPRKGKDALNNSNPVASTSTEPEERELLDDEQDEEVGEEVVQDESFDANWSGNLVCVADPFIVAKNCTGQIKKLIFTRFIHECRNAEGMLRLGISLESILSKEPPVWETAAGRPKKGKKNQTNKVQGKQTQGNRVPAEEPKLRSRPGSSHSGVQRGGSNTHQSGRGRRGAPQNAT